MKTKKARVKQVFTRPADVIKLYAAQSQAYAESKYNARNGQRGLVSCYFSGRDLYSYGQHFLLARMGVNINGVSCAVINWTHYSRSTDEQQGIAASELQAAGYLVVKVLDPYAKTMRLGATDSAIEALALAQLKNMAEYLDKAQDIIRAAPSELWRLEDLKVKINDHNSLTIALNLPKLYVKVQADKLREAFRLHQLNTKARLDHSKREQLLLISYTDYRESSRRWRQTA